MVKNSSIHLVGGELGDGLGTFTDGVLGKFTRKHQTNSSLDFSRRKSSLLVVGGEASGFRGDTFKDIVNERVHDRHTLLGDTGIRVDLLEHLVDVRRVGFGTLLALGLSALGSLGRSLGGLLGRSLGHGGN